MQLLSEFNKGIRFLLCATDIFSKYAWVSPLKDKKGNAITDVFQKILNEPVRKPNKIWVDKGSEFYNKSLKSWLEKDDIEMHSPHNEGKSVVAERSIKSTNIPIISISKNLYVAKFDDIVIQQYMS